MKHIPAGFLITTLLIPSAWPATFNVTRMDDPAPNGCGQADCSLREAVIDADQTVAHDVIMLPAGTYLIDLDGFDSSEDTGDLDITNDLEIVGAPSTIDGQNFGRIMDITGTADVTLRNLTLQNANTSLDTNGSLNAGAIEADGASLHLFDVTFLSNRAQALGGAVRAFGGTVVEIERCLFSGNHADNGAAIHADTGITVRNSVFEENRADVGALGSGAVAYLAGTTSDSLFERVRFEGNFANGAGGAVQFLGRALVVDVLVATDNEANGGAGGVFSVPGTGHAKEAHITSVRFNGNMAETGGAMATAGDDDTITIEHSSFVGNQATAGDGGALRFTGGMVSVVNNTFSGNQATGNGGAAYQFGGEVGFSHNTFSGGTASLGNAIYVGGSSAISMLELANNLIDGACSISNADTVTSLGGNVEGPGDSCELVAGSDLVNQTAELLGLQPLRVNYNATATHELSPDSVARGQGEAGVCSQVEVDQLFESRDMCNSGAVESEVIFKDSYETSIFDI